MWWEVALLVVAALVVTEVVIGADAGGAAGGGRVPVVGHLVKVDPLPSPVSAQGVVAGD